MCTQEWRESQAWSPASVPLWLFKKGCKRQTLGQETGKTRLFAKKDAESLQGWREMPTFAPLSRKEGHLAQLVQSVCLTSRGSGVRIPQCPQKRWGCVVIKIYGAASSFLVPEGGIFLSAPFFETFMFMNRNQYGRVAVRHLYLWLFNLLIFRKQYSAYLVNEVSKKTLF